MKVVNVDFVENEMVEMNVVQIGLNWGWIEVECGVGCDCDGDGCGDTCGDACGDGYAKKTRFTAYLPTPKPIILHPLPNQSKPIVSTLSPISFSYLILLSLSPISL